MTISSGKNTGVNHAKLVATLTAAQRDALLGKLAESRDIKAPKDSNHQNSSAPIYFQNQSGMEVPPYACMQVVGTTESGGQNYLLIEQPADGDGTNGWYVFNGHCRVADGDKGLCHDGVLVRSLTEGSPSAGDKVSPQANSWYVAEGSLFPVAGADDIADGVYRIFVAGGGGGGKEVMFTIDEVYGTAIRESDLCDDRLRDAKDRYKATCVKVSCGTGAPATDEDGTFEVVDYLGFLTGRDESDVIGKTGLASYMGSCDGYGECEWVITWIDWFRERTVIVGFTLTDDSLCFEFENVKVWDHCELPDQCIALTDCEDY
jgi:hypothetical protein